MPFSYRPYTTPDHDSLLAIFRRNVPQSFADDEIADFDAFLANLPGPYYVVELDGQLIGACGYALLTNTPDIARICWIFADSAQQNRGFGTFILTTIEAELRTLPGVTTVDARSSQVAYRFFEKNGYALIETQFDYWAPGFDLYWLRKRLQPNLEMV